MRRDLAEMTSKSKTNRDLTNDELLAQFDDLGATPTQSTTSKPKSSRTPKNTSNATAPETDALAELESLAIQRPSSRPSTPSLRQPQSTPSGARSPKRNSTQTPPPGSYSLSVASRSSEERSNPTSTAPGVPRKSGESTRSFHQSFTPATTTTEESPEPDREPAPQPARLAPQSGSSWWGGLLSTATAAVSQAQAAVKEIQKNEEAQRWAEQMKGNVSTLRGFGKVILSLFLLLIPKSMIDH